MGAFALSFVRTFTKFSIQPLHGVRIYSPFALQITSTKQTLLSLSAHLAELTKNKTYLSAALLAAQFEESQLLVPETNLVGSGITLGSKSNCSKLSTSPNSEWNAPLLEAYAILADVTGDDKWRKQCVLSPILRMRLAN
jgi:hypothetical protein